MNDDVVKSPQLNKDILDRIDGLRNQSSAESLRQVEESVLANIKDTTSKATRRKRSTPSIGEVADFIRNDLAFAEGNVKFRDVGTVQHIGNGVATLSGLPHVKTDGLVEFSTGVRGLVLNLDHNHLDVILLGPSEGISGGALVVSVGERLTVPVGPRVVGRILNALGDPLDEGGSVFASDFWVLERVPPSIVDREPVHEPLQTGTKIIDALLPIGKGQRELIVGDRQTGKTSLAVDAILNQAGKDVLCIYVAVGQKKSSTLAVIQTLQKHGAMRYTTVVMSSPDDPPAMRYLAPYTGCTMAEYLLEMGNDVLIVYDDLTKHADSYRELSLLLRRSPGREAYPGDIFYLHSRLLERACKVKDGASITALPIVTTQRGNISAYIPTNLISITDGQIVLDADQFNRGVKPAIDIGMSVSRVGGAAQTKAMRTLSGDLRLQIAQFEEVARFARFGTDIDESTKQQIETGQRLQVIMQQRVHAPLSLGNQVFSLFLAVNEYLNEIPLRDIPKFERGFQQYINRKAPEIEVKLNSEGLLTEKMVKTIKKQISAYKEEWDQAKGKDIL
ncbi:MAG: F0F1 ATP synthase subunit alpha [Anaerolineae bacterium]|jgi:F-type H+-transporting ATPase subunit alpha|nr:F0F1 ATP synthase subunit alpha [Anaerolineae bacterium]